MNSSKQQIEGICEETSRDLTVLSAFLGEHNSAGPPLWGLSEALAAVLCFLGKLTHHPALKHTWRTYEGSETITESRGTAMAALPWLR